jgi:hypothetical protein
VSWFAPPTLLVAPQQGWWPRLRSCCRGSGTHQETASQRGGWLVWRGLVSLPSRSKQELAPAFQQRRRWRIASGRCSQSERIDGTPVWQQFLLFLKP